MTGAADGCDGCGESWEREAWFWAWFRKRERELTALRVVWEACDDRAALAAVLQELVAAQRKLSELTGVLRLGDLTTWREIAVRTLAAAEINPAIEVRTPAGYRAVADLGADATVDPAELLCAVRCWEAGEPYIPRTLVSSHPRWPDPIARAVALSVLRSAGTSDPDEESERGER